MNKTKAQMNIDKTLADFLNDLNPAEKEVLMKSTLSDWFNAVGSLFRDPEFWKGLGQAALLGAAEGFRDFADDQDYQY